MRVIVHVPFGAVSQEAGLIFILASYLRSMFPEVVHLRCNGIFSVCDRDGGAHWQRDSDACFLCMREQLGLARWANIASEALSRCLLAQDVDMTRRLVVSTAVVDLLGLEFEGLCLLDLCRASFHRRFGTDQPDLQNKNHEQFLRRLMLSAARMCAAAKRFNHEFKPEIVLVAGGRDYISRSLVEVCRRDGYQPVVFRWDTKGGGINIVHPHTHQVMACDLLLDGITTMRPDIATWPKELIGILQQILDFLDISDRQLTLAIGKA